MLRVALTGGISTGKSYVSSRFRGLGVPVADADVLAHQVVAAGTPGLTAVRKRFGDVVITAGGDLHRERLAEIVFRDAQARRDLEAIVHPAVREGIERFFMSLPQTVPYAVADIPLLFETGREREFAKVVVVTCTSTRQMERLAARGMSREQAQRRIAAQIPNEVKVGLADYVIHTDGSFEDTNRQVADVADALLRLARG